MTEQQAQSPIDDLFRKSFEDLPNTPAESGWDTPSERVWQHVQANIQQPSKGWSTQSFVWLALLAITLAAGLYWLFARPNEKPTVPSTVTPVEQPVVTPSATAPPATNQPVSAPKPSTGNGVVKETPNKPAPRNSTEEKISKPGNNAAQPLPGSKPTLAPNTTEAQKKKASGN